MAIAAGQRCIECSNNVEIAVFVPKAAISAFKKDFKKAGVKYSTYVTGDINVDKEARFHLFSYSRLDEFIKWQCSHEKPIIGVFDEVHFLGNKNQTTEKLLMLRKRFAFVVGMSGTPLQDKAEAVFPIINFINPGFLKSYIWFKDNFLTTEKVWAKRGNKRVQIEKISGLKNNEVLSKHLSKMMFTKSRKYNMDFQYRSCFMDEEEREFYVKSSKGILEEDNETVFSARLHDLQRVVDGSLVEMDRKTLASKERLLISTLTEIMSRNESTLVYCLYEDTYKRLYKILESYKHLIGYSKLHLITGKVKYEDRLKVEKDMPLKSIVLMTKAGTQSINLQAANNIVFFTLPWDCGSLIQAVGRITRSDTTFDTQHVYFLESTDTIDTYRRLLIESKLSMITSVFGSQPTLPDIKPFEIDKKELKKYMLWKKY